ncbi:MAG TPA: hypothetical protein VK997_08790 [Deferrisomatales bacterium]|nr:hypothetical protein [Deferrisomatales bacterium]
MSDFRICPACGYSHGFHVAFRDTGNGPHILLICPSCGHSYDPGWVVQLSTDPPRRGPVFSPKEAPAE